MSELSDKALDAIKDSVRAEILKDSNGNEYSAKALTLIRPPKIPAPGVTKVATLTGFVDYILHHKDKKGEEDPAIVVIGGPTTACLYSEPFGFHKQETLFCHAAFEELLGTSFRFGQFYAQEEFIIGLQSLFEPTPTRNEILQLIATIKKDSGAEWTDDGVSQTVTAKAGVALVKPQQVPNPVILQPFRTFREIEQPESPFILRIRDGQRGPEAALYEGDGGRWKLTAIQRIKEYLEDKIKLPIIA